jgi:GntR family transcriptional regulator
MFELDLRSRKPIYEQLVDKMKELIINEVLKPDEQLPSVRQMAQQLTINPNTIQKAYRELEVQGFIFSLKGKGSFVNTMDPGKDADKILKVKQDLEKMLQEALYLGITAEELHEMIGNIDGSKGGSGQDD